MLSNEFEILFYRTQKVHLSLKESNIITDIFNSEFYSLDGMVSYKEQIFSMSHIRLENTIFVKINEFFKFEVLSIKPYNINENYLPDINYKYRATIDEIYIYKFDESTLVKKFSIKELIGSSDKFILFVDKNDKIICYDPLNDCNVELMQYNENITYNVLKNNILLVTTNEDTKFINFPRYKILPYELKNKIIYEFYSYNKNFFEILSQDGWETYYYNEEKLILSQENFVHNLVIPYSKKILIKYQEELLLFFPQQIISYIILHYL